MSQVHDTEAPVTGFFRPFFQARSGHIMTLSAPGDRMRDGLAVTQIARYFPLPEFGNIRVEPSRSSIQPAANVVLLGSASLFLSPAGRGADNGPLRAAHPRLRERLQRLHAECCFHFIRKGPQVQVVNRMTGKTFQPLRRNDEGFEEDYGVIRRLYRGPTENTVVLEGIHRLGTLGAAKVLTDASLLAAFWRALQALEPRDDSCPVEILVKTTFDPTLSDGVQALEAIHAEPLALVYDRRWQHGLNGTSRWTDQGPWDVRLLLRGGRPAVAFPADGVGPPVPRLEVQVDLSGADERLRRQCRELLVVPEVNGKRGNGVAASRADVTPDLPALSDARRKEAARLLEKLTGRARYFRLTLVESSPYSRQTKDTPLPVKPSDIRRLRKRFLLHLVLGRLLGLRFVCDEAGIRRIFPELAERAGSKAGAGRPLTGLFTNAVSGKLREGFGPLLGTARRPSGYLSVEYLRKERTYELRLESLAVLVKMML